MAQAPGNQAGGSGYRNPFRGSHVSGSRIDQGVDYNGSPGSPIYAVGPGVVDQVFQSGSGWPGGGWVSYVLSSGPAAGSRVYVAEDVSPTVQPGQAVNANVVVGRFNQAGSIETGWAGPKAKGDQTLAAFLNQWNTTSGDPGKYSTEAGVTFNNLIVGLGGPAGFVTPGGIRGNNQKIVNTPVSGSTPPGGAGSSAGGSTSDCLVGFPGVLGVGSFCILHKSGGRALIGGLMLAGGGLVMFAGTAVLVATAFSNTGVGKAAVKVAKLVPK